MTKLIVHLRSLARDEKGQDLIEYALLASLIACFAIAGLLDGKNEVEILWNNIAADLKAAIP
jgi:Flp pilus assembly pilin Flp